MKLANIKQWDTVGHRGVLWGDILKKKLKTYFSIFFVRFSDKKLYIELKIQTEPLRLRPEIRAVLLVYTEAKLHFACTSKNLTDNATGKNCMSEISSNFFQLRTPIMTH